MTSLQVSVEVRVTFSKIIQIPPYEKVGERPGDDLLCAFCDHSGPIVIVQRAEQTLDVCKVCAAKYGIIW
jgi:hypothetical protein